MTDWKELNPAEVSRTYSYANGEQIRYTDVSRIRVSDSGNHYLETGDGMKHIVAPGWRAIDIDTPAWTF